MHTQTTNSKKKRMGCLGKGLSIIGVLLVFLIVLVIGGSIYEARAATAVATQYPTPS